MIRMLTKEVWATLGVSKIHGVGVFAIRDIPAHTEVGWWTKEYIEIPKEEFQLLPESIRNTILDRMIFYDFQENLIFRHPNSIVQLQCFMNHSENPNSDGLRTLRDIKAGEEITENFKKLSGYTISDITLKRMPFLK